MVPTMVHARVACLLMYAASLAAAFKPPRRTARTTFPVPAACYAACALFCVSCLCAIVATAGAFMEMPLNAEDADVLAESKDPCEMVPFGAKHLIVALVAFGAGGMMGVDNTLRSLVISGS